MDAIMASRDPTRLRQGLNPLTTSMGMYTNQHPNQMSAVTRSPPHMVAQTPASSIMPYNPQNWGMTPGAAADQAVQYADPQASPPPPPYSPPRSQPPGHPVGVIFDQAQVSTPPPRMSPAVHRPSPEPQSVNQSFPPPPGGARGASRDRRFGLPTLRNRRDADRNTNSPEPQLAVARSRQSMVMPSTFHVASPEPHADHTYNPPAARRAASAGPSVTPTAGRSRSASQTRWAPGMPLPPPPPGPPPASSRSQSVQAVDRTPAPIMSPPTRRPPPSTGGSTLGPVPPTPADWLDSDHPPPPPPVPAPALPPAPAPAPVASPSPAEPARGRDPGLTIDTATANSSEQQSPEALGSSASSAGLSRARAVRHDKTIIQRRNESRTRQGTRGSVDERKSPGLISNIVIPSTSTVLARRMAANKGTPRSGQLETPGTGESILMDSRNSTPRAVQSAKLPKLETETPPFSPLASKQAQQGSQSASATVAPKALPTPPPHTRSASDSVPRDSSRPPSATLPLSKYQIVMQTAEQFETGTVERFRDFAAKEAVAATDAERVRLFADFIVSESRIRRERYSAAHGAMGSEIFDLTRDLFRPMGSHTRRASDTSREASTPASAEPTRPRRGSVGSSYGDGTQSTPGSAGIPDSPSGGGNSNWAQNYKPSLSPILSMSMSDVHDDGSSRGRPPSRWWEVDSQGEPSRLERSKRESKYMGVSKTQWYDDEQATPSAGPSNQAWSSSEYPPEKVGWHEEGSTLTPQPFNRSTTSISSTISSTPTSVTHRDLLDVSRLVTMPPPYPRHHPAVNNNHPELTETRISVRSLSEISEVTTTKEKFEAGSKKRRGEFAKAAADRRQALRANLQSEINSGNISYSDAGMIEQDAQRNEIDMKKELEKSEYEKFQNEVVVPCNELLTGRISKATDLFDDLSRKLFDDGRIDADIPQEEGDDRPELLEKLTLLKWIFEARETLHKANYDLLSDRNSRYCEVILTPYRLTGNNEKLKQATDFFAEDAAKREYAYANEALDRAREFRAVIDEAVTQGITLQLSAFWDIAPPLCDLLENIPLDLEDFHIRIPAAEFEENPAYHEHPMQYLFSLLLHAEKSTYQFIEAHTNLLCILHEVKELVVNAKGRVLETQIDDGSGKPIRESERQENARHMRRVEEERLTEDLKEKVRVVQDQWKNALGENITHVKERLGEWLLETGGWDESLEDGGVGGV